MMFQRILNRMGAPETPPPWGLGIAFTNLAAAFFALIIGINVALVVLGDTPYGLFVGWSLGAALAIAFAWFTRRTGAEKGALRLGAIPVATLFMVLLLGLGMVITLDVISFRVVGQFVSDPELATVYGQPVTAITWVFAALFMVVMQPAAEELVFRGIILPALRVALGGWFGLLTNALLYAAFHMLAYLPQGANSEVALWYGLVVPFIGGLFFGGVRVVTGSTRAAVAAHVAFGLFAVMKAMTLAG
jgi:membrane protease YdiL (CAAX protease family)